MWIDFLKPALTIVEFSDFQCPYCRNTYENIEKIRVKRPNAITLVYRNFPIDALHPHARDAALAAICSARQGRFPAYYHFAFTHQDSIGKLAWGDVAARIGIADRDVFDRCREDPATMALISSDSAAAATLKIGGTPLLLVGERAVYGAPSYEVLDQFVSDAIKKSSAQ